MNVLAAVVTAAISQQGIWITEAEIMELPMSGSAWDNVFSDAQNSISADLGSPSSDGDTTAYAKALVFVRTGDESYRQDVISGIENAMGTEGNSVRYLGLGLLGYIIAGDLVGLPAGVDADWKSYLASVRFDNLGESRNLIEVHEERPNNWGTTAGASRLALALYIGDTSDFERGVDVLMGWLDGQWPHDYGDDCWRQDYSPPQGINPVGSDWAGALPDDQRRGGCPPNVGCENYVRSGLAGVIAQALIVQRNSPADSWGHEQQAIRRAYQFQEDNGCGWPGDDEWQPWLVNWAYGSSFDATSSPNHGKSMGYTDWTHASGGPGGPFCGDGAVDPGEDCQTCPADAPCPPGLLCDAGACVDPPGDCSEDLNGDGEVGIQDFLQLLGAWGPCQ